MTVAEKTYTRDGIKVYETGCRNGSTAREYILASSACSVEPAALRELFERHSPIHDSSPAASGRGKVSTFSHQGQDLLLRQYRRGGMIARISQYSYVWAGLARSRAFTELALLDELHRAAAPVCQPFAARVVRKGLLYQAGLMTVLVPQSATLGVLLQQGRLQPVHWQSAGRAIRQMHKLGVWHADLNAHNILLSGEQAVLIDFDRGRRRSQGSENWQAANLKRLARSIEKLCRQQGMEFDQAGWQALNAAYA